MDVKKFAEENDLKYKEAGRELNLYELDLESISEYSNCLINRTPYSINSKVLKVHLEISFLCLCTDEGFFDYGCPINECMVRIREFTYPKDLSISYLNGLYVEVVVNTIDDDPLHWDHKCMDMKEAEYLAEEFIKSCVGIRKTFLVVNIQNFMDKFGFSESELDRG